ncbi:hypothetical protein GMA19_02115 [Paenibacillus polymyxa E681]|uniref:hypothetical protein n=1 Tax=Paenibacillus polymyxa TaxID=1406 RepID=UPI0001E31FE2|nr:hypothetical protein [Paenibacillus polymyxa]ADM69928.1 hypothetical protein PPE_02092 [Paenibacillus polymyxa E681]QNV56951.1 hypothetical protein GE561_02115 [Paenibacillus polymyxa E681]QNV61788.1 hypothetical protein GMA19_02115 [Paenibacillus polymyxa E681]
MTPKNQALQSNVNRSVLDTHGYTETVFEFPNNQVKKLFVKRLANYEAKNDPYDYVINPNFYGVVYPSILIEIFMTPKTNILVQKSVNNQVQFENGQIIQEQAMNKTIDLIIFPNLENSRNMLPDSLFQSVAATLSVQNPTSVRPVPDEMFRQEL